MSQENAVPVISARGLTKRYNGKAAVDGVSFDIPAGRIVGLIGVNGSGKTTTLKAALGLASFEGELKVLGRNPVTQRDLLCVKCRSLRMWPCCPSG